MDYEKLYRIMYRAATDALEFLLDNNVRLARNVLMMAQWEADSLEASQSKKGDNPPGKTGQTHEK